MPEPVPSAVHIVVGRIGDCTYLKPSVECDRIYLVGLLTEALSLLTRSSALTVRPSDCPVQVFLTVEVPRG